MTVPTTPPDEFDPPPRTFEDREGREVEVRRYDGKREALVGMYLAFDPADRAQGIPPTQEDRIRTWLDAVLDDDCLNAVTWHGGDAVGHAMLVPDREGASELAIFVLDDYQGAGIGTVLLESLLGYGAETGVEEVWLTVERWNHPAIGLYEKTGFEARGDPGFELEMVLTLDG
jgi:GNAT superfamily N-acetyltransferase